MLNKIDLSGNFLKIVACVTMLIDHIGVALVGTWLEMITDLTLYHQVYRFYWLLRGIGRLAFPLFIFLLIEGFFHTHNRWKYLGRLSMFMLLSELPFDLALNLSLYSIADGTLFYFGAQNVYFTLVIGFVGIFLAEAISEQFPAGWKGRLLVILDMILCAELAFTLNTDYGIAGIVAIFTGYLMHDASNELEMTGIVLMLTALSSQLEIIALADVLLVHFYYGKRGRKMNKWVFYAFYPVHLLVLFLLRLLIF